VIRSVRAPSPSASTAVLTVSDVLSETLTTEETYLPLDELERATDRMIVSALGRSLAFDATLAAPLLPLGTRERVFHVTMLVAGDRIGPLLVKCANKAQASLLHHPP